MAAPTGIQFIVDRMRPHAGALSVVALGEVLAAGLALAFPQFAAASLDLLSTGALTLSASLLAAGGVWAARLVTTSYAQYLLEVVALRLERRTRADLQAHLLNLRLADQMAYGSTTLIDMEFRDLEGVRGFLLALPAQALGAVITGVGALAFAWHLSASLTLACLAIGLPLLIGVKVAGRFVERASKAYWDAVYASDHVGLENLRHATLLKSLAQVDSRVQQFDARLGTNVEAGRSRARVTAVYSPVMRLIELAGVVGVVALASVEGVSGPTDVRSMSEFVMYSFLLLEPLRTLANTALQMRRLRPGIERLNDALARPMERRGGSTPTLTGAFEVRALSFGYSTQSLVLQDISLRVDPGEMLGLVGPNGGGKSTLAGLLTGLWTPHSGAVLFDGHDLEELDLEHLRRQVVLVSQHTELLDANLRENVALAAHDASQDTLDHAAHLALLDEVVEQVGWDTMIGESGMRLSGGQRQRVALARAIAANPKILVLDEATSMFDPESELVFLTRAQAWLAQRTVVFISHRGAPLARAHRILRIDGGRLTTQTADIGAHA